MTAMLLSRYTALSVALVCALITTGCADDPTQPSGLSTSTVEAPHDHGVVTPAPEADASTEASATRAAVATMVAFSHTDLTSDEWIQQMYPVLSSAGVEAHTGTDPQQIPVHKVTGEARVLEGSSEVALIVQVPTDAGLYLVSLSRTSTDVPWLADRIRPAT